MALQCITICKYATGNANIWSSSQTYYCKI